MFRTTQNLTKNEFVRNIQSTLLQTSSEPANENHKLEIVIFNFLWGQVCEFGNLPIVFLLENA